jgi:hypothetical protein
MDNRAPDFYLSAAGEYTPLADVRSCWRGKRLRDGHRDDYLEITIDPPLIGQLFGLGATAISRLLIASRLRGFSLFPVNEWPVPVYIVRILDDHIVESGYFTAGQVQLIAWGMIYESLAQKIGYTGTGESSAIS